jgi:hypothetical protein
VPKEDHFGVAIGRVVPRRYYPFTQFFKGFEKVPAVRELFGSKTAAVLRAQKVEFFSARWGYMGTSDEDGHLLISVNHLRTSDFRTLYLDLVHELCHVRQFRRGQPLFYPKLSYVDAPSEIDAYRRTVAEGRRIGMTDKELFDYLTIEWITPVELRRLARHTGLPPKFWKKSRRAKKR